MIFLINNFRVFVKVGGKFCIIDILYNDGCYILEFIFFEKREILIFLVKRVLELIIGEMGKELLLYIFNLEF